MTDKDTDEGGGADGQDGPDGDRLLGVAQVSRAVGASHDTWRGSGEKNYQSNKQKETKKQVCEEKNTAVLTCDRREVDADQQSEKGGDVIDHVGQVDILAAIASSVGGQLLVVYQLAQTAVL